MCATHRCKMVTDIWGMGIIIHTHHPPFLFFPRMHFLMDSSAHLHHLCGMTFCLNWRTVTLVDRVLNLALSQLPTRNRHLCELLFKGHYMNPCIDWFDSIHPARSLESTVICTSENGKLSLRVIMGLKNASGSKWEKPIRYKQIWKICCFFNIV